MTERADGTRPYVHALALCDSSLLGRGARIEAFARVLAGARVGADCSIGEGAFLGNEALLADRVVVGRGAQLECSVHAEDDVHIGPLAVLAAERLPGAGAAAGKKQRIFVREGASIGANATLLPGIEIGAGAMIGAGSVVTRSVPPNAVALGSPAHIVRYVGAGAADGAAPVSPPAAGAVRAVGVGGVDLHELPLIKDLRGSLSVGEFERTVPFRPRRHFLVFDVSSREIRGEHAHRKCHQFLICVHGACAVVVDDGRERREVQLDRPNLGLYLPPMVWGVQYKYTADAVLLVFASHFYDPADYIREYQEFRRLVGT